MVGLYTNFVSCCQSVAEDRGDVQAVFRAAVISTSLRLRHASCQVRTHRRRQPQAQVPQPERSHPSAQSHHGRQPAKVPLTGAHRTALNKQNDEAAPTRQSRVHEMGGRPPVETFTSF